MTYKAEHQALTAWFNDQWAGATPVQWENTDLSRPRDTQGIPLPYVVFTIMNGPARQIELGKATNNYRHEGMVIVQILVPEDTGTGAILDLADSVAAIFRSKQFNVPYITLKTPSIGRIGRNSGGYYQLNVVVEYHRDSDF